MKTEYAIGHLEPFVSATTDKLSECWENVKLTAKIGSLVLRLPKLIKNRGRVELTYSITNNCDGSPNSSWQVRVVQGLPGQPHGQHGWSHFQNVLQALEEPFV